MDPENSETLALPDGRGLIVRPIEPGDKAALEDGFARLGARSRYRRFLAPQSSLAPQQLRYLTEVDHHDHEALIAFDAETGQTVAVARYVRRADTPALAELAVTVVDDWQGCGVGTVLVEALVERARAEGIESFSALVLSENSRMLNLLEELGAPKIVKRDSGSIELIVDLPSEGLGDIVHLLRHAAGGEVELGRPGGLPSPA